MIVAAILVFYLTKGTALYAFQRNFLYVPYHDAVVAPPTVTPPVKVVTVTTNDGLQLQTWFSPPAKPDGTVVVFFHGNGGSLPMSAQILPYFQKRGYGIYLCEYRGYSGNPGSPTEEGLYEDGRACMKWLQGEGYSPGQIAIYGESIGTGVAVQMAAEMPPKTLILTSPFTSMVDMARRNYYFYPVGLMLKDKYDSLSKIGKIKSPLLILHGDADGMVPMDMGKGLFDAANEPKEFHSVHGAGHNDLYSFGASKIIAAWLDKELPSERQK
ncbi:MAG: alpha/beta hydrolase [Alphaproteobacteria bacterium]